jgi:outer membrane protein assembly factor BamE (lipoprotein component of BamABCDE complex)
MMTVFCGVSSGFEEEYRLFRQVKNGMTEAQVTELLGQPYRSYEKSNAPEDYYVKGYSFKKRAITNKVLIYIKVEPICYVYLDQNGIVEDVFVGGS